MTGFVTLYWTTQQWYEHYVKVLPDITKAIAEWEKYCIDPMCKETHWQGYNRLHTRGERCPAMTTQGWAELMIRADEIKEFINKHEKRVVVEEKNVEHLVEFYADKILRALK